MHSAKEKKDETGILDARIFYFFGVTETDA
jgi:hypothetical protein